MCNVTLHKTQQSVFNAQCSMLEVQCTGLSGRRARGNAFTKREQRFTFTLYYTSHFFDFLLFFFYNNNYIEKRRNKDKKENIIIIVLRKKEEGVSLEKKNKEVGVL